MHEYAQRICMPKSMPKTSMPKVLGYAERLSLQRIKKITVNVKNVVDVTTILLLGPPSNVGLSKLIIEFLFSTL